jgi:hypothetical protein
MPEIHCEQHGVFTYKYLECPGCTYEQHTEALAAAQKALDAGIMHVLADRNEERESLLSSLADLRLRLEWHLHPPSDVLAELKNKKYVNDMDRYSDPYYIEIQNIESSIINREKQLESFSTRYSHEDNDVIREIALTQIDPTHVRMLLAEQHRIEMEEESIKAIALRQNQDLETLNELFGIRHVIGQRGKKYSNLKLLGSADIGDKRYARLLSENMHERFVTCVPWILMFADQIGKTISVLWVEPKQFYQVSNSDGCIPISKTAPIAPETTAANNIVTQTPAPVDASATASNNTGAPTSAAPVVDNSGTPTSSQTVPPVS